MHSTPNYILLGQRSDGELLSFSQVTLSPRLHSPAQAGGSEHRCGVQLKVHNTLTTEHHMCAAEQTAEDAYRDRVVGNKVYWCVCRWPSYNLCFLTFIRKGITAQISEVQITHGLVSALAYK